MDRELSGDVRSVEESVPPVDGACERVDEVYFVEEDAGPVEGAVLRLVGDDPAKAALYELLKQDLAEDAASNAVTSNVVTTRKVEYMDREHDGDGGLEAELDAELTPCYRTQAERATAGALGRVERDRAFAEQLATLERQLATFSPTADLEPLRDRRRQAEFELAVSRRSLFRVVPNSVSTRTHGPHRGRAPRGRRAVTRVASRSSGGGSPGRSSDDPPGEPSPGLAPVPFRAFSERGPS